MTVVKSSMVEKVCLSGESQAMRPGIARICIGTEMSCIQLTQKPISGLYTEYER